MGLKCKSGLAQQLGIQEAPTRHSLLTGKMLELQERSPKATPRKRSHYSSFARWSCCARVSLLRLRPPCCGTSLCTWACDRRAGSLHAAARLIGGRSGLSFERPESAVFAVENRCVCRIRRPSRQKQAAKCLIAFVSAGYPTVYPAHGAVPPLPPTAALKADPRQTAGAGRLGPSAERTDLARIAPNPPPDHGSGALRRRRRRGTPAPREKVPFSPRADTQAERVTRGRRPANECATSRR